MAPNESPKKENDLADMERCLALHITSYKNRWVEHGFPELENNFDAVLEARKMMQWLLGSDPNYAKNQPHDRVVADLGGKWIQDRKEEIRKTREKAE